jgi:pimeloyl-ACP methyl ester carboxylesterase
MRWRRAAMGLALASLACAHTEPFLDANGQIVPGSIAAMETLPIGGIEQAVLLRGRSTTNPVLILLHGGPGVSETALFRAYDAALEDHFVVVYWDQRGAGRSFDADIPPESMTLDRFVADLDELVDAMRARFGVGKVALLGHSWGTALGLVYAARQPDEVSVYVGVAQVADMAAGERLSWQHALDAAVQRADRDAERALVALGPPPHDVDGNLESRRWNERFGGSFHADLSTGRLVWAALRTDEADLTDLVRFGRGNRFSLEHLWPEFRALDLTGVRAFDVPIVFALGRHDWQVPATLAAAYFETLAAPCKRLVWFEGSAHNVPFEEPAAFVEWMARDVAPLARGGCAAGGP